MANLEVTDLSIIPDPVGADVYGAKNNLDWRIRTGEPGGLATLDGSGNIDPSQIDATDYVKKSDTADQIVQSELISVLNLTTRHDVGAGTTYFRAENAGGTLLASLLVHSNGWQLRNDAGGAFLAIDNNDTWGLFGTTTGTINGTVTVTGDIISGQTYSSSTANVVIGGNGTPGGIFLRPNGPANATAQAVFQNASITFGVSLFVTSKIETNGPNGGVFIRDRITDREWGWYGHSDIFRAWRGDLDIMTGTPGGVWSAPNFIATSDERLKKDITDKPARLDLIDKLRLVEFVWKADERKDIGLIAQEVQKIAPEYVHDTEGTLAIDKTNLLLECVVGLAARVRELEEKLNA